MAIHLILVLGSFTNIFSFFRVVLKITKNGKKLFYEKIDKNGNFGFVFKIVISLIVGGEGFVRRIKKNFEF